MNGQNKSIHMTDEKPDNLCRGKTNSAPGFKTRKESQGDEILNMLMCLIVFLIRVTPWFCIREQNVSGHFRAYCRLHGNTPGSAMFMEHILMPVFLKQLFSNAFY